MKTTKNKPRGVKVIVGDSEVTKLGVGGFDRHDVYHRIMSLTWPRFFAAAVSIYLIVNVVFAFAYYLGDNAINNARPGSFLDCFFFSVETLATVGYGNMSPATLYGHVVATIEILTGTLSLAAITSVVFARFSKPTASLVFSKHAVIGTHNGVPTLMIRVANKRSSFILEANASLNIVRQETSMEGVGLRRFHELKLDRSRSPMFALSWLIMHTIDETSPLYGKTMQDFMDEGMRLALTISGMDETYAATTTTRHSYSPEDIRMHHRFVDIFIEGESKRQFSLDFDKFHHIEPITTPSASMGTPGLKPDGYANISEQTENARA